MDEPEFRQNQRNAGAEYALREVKKITTQVYLKTEKDVYTREEVEAIILGIENHIDTLIEEAQGNWL